MDELRQCTLDQLIARALLEHLVDACEQVDGRVRIVQGDMHFVLDPLRAHAFLRGVILGMGRCEEEPQPHPLAAVPPLDAELPHVPAGYGLVDAFRRYLLTQWWLRYEQAGFPLGRTSNGMQRWIEYNTATTQN